MELNKLAEIIHENAVSKGFWKDFYKYNEKGFKKDFLDIVQGKDIATKLCLIHSEVSEALESYRKNDSENFKEEFADIIIRTLDLAEGLGINIEKEITKKMEYNKSRDYMHGNKRF